MPIAVTIEDKIAVVRMAAVAPSANAINPAFMSAMHRRARPK